MSKKKAYSDKLKDIIDYQPSWIIRWGNTFFIVLIISSMIFANFIKYPEIIIGKAYLSSSNPPQKITNKITAAIDTVFVNDNDIVIKNQPLILLENDASYNDITFLKEIIKKNPFTKDSIFFPINTMPILLLGSIQKEYSSFEKLYLEFDLFKKLNKFEIKQKANLFNIEEKKRKLSSLENQLNINYKELSLLNKNLSRSKKLLNKGVISQKEYENDQLKHLEKRKIINDTKVLISELKNDLGNNDESFELNELALNSELKQLIKSVIHSYNQLKVSVKKWERNFLITSNKNGIVTFNKVYTKKQFINENEFIGSIANIEESIPIVKVYAPLNNSGKIKVGQQVNLKFDNFNYIEFGIVYGTVKNISKLPNKEGNYLISIDLKNGLITSYNKNLEFKNEITGTGEIITSDKTIFKRIFEQFYSLLNNR